MKCPSSLRPVLPRPCKSLKFQCRHVTRQLGPGNFKRLQLGDTEQSQNDTGGSTPASTKNEVENDKRVEDQWSQLSPKATIRRSLSGIQPTGVPHLGNYLGALRQWKELHDQANDPRFSTNYRYEQYFSVVDLHALTADIPGPERARLRKESYAALLAIGLWNNANTALFFQSNVSALLPYSRTKLTRARRLGNIRT